MTWHHRGWIKGRAAIDYYHQLSSFLFADCICMSNHNTVTFALESRLSPVNTDISVKNNTLGIAHSRLFFFFAVVPVLPRKQ